MRVALPFAALALLAACADDAQAPVDSEVAPASAGDDEILAEGEVSLADPTSEGATRQLAAIPPRFRGVWDYIEGSCDPMSDLRVEIAAKELLFYEARGAVKEARMDGENAIVITLAMAGEGEQWEQSTRFAFGEDGTLIPTAVGEEQAGAPMPLKRCPA